jgi:hypothetical protein
MLFCTFRVWLHLQHADPEYAALSDAAELDEAWAHFGMALESDPGDLEVGGRGQGVQGRGGIRQ